MCFVRLGDFAGYFSFLWDWNNISFLGVWFSDTFGWVLVVCLWLILVHGSEGLR